jgi:hypothetical protein
MTVRWSMFPGQELPAKVATMPSQMSRGGTQTCLEIIVSGVPTLLPPGNAQGIEVLGATPGELETLKNAGFNLPLAAKRSWWKFWK